MPANDFLDTLRHQTLELRDTVASWRALPVSQLLERPEAGSWSPAQCLDHLNGYGEFYLPHLERALASSRAASKPFQSGWLGNYFATSMDPKPDGRPKSKMKAFAKHVPLPDLDAAAVTATFLAQQDQMLRLLDRARELDLNRRVIPLSIAAWLRLKTGDVFRFMVAHHRRHLAQALRAIAQAEATRSQVA